MPDSALTAPASAEAGVRRRARVAVAVTFVANGVLIGSWAPRIPDVKADLGLSAGALGIALLGPALGTILAARIVGARTARHGSAAVARVCSVAYCLLAWLPAAATNLGLLWLSLVIWGTAMGAMDVAMNAQGVTVEGAYGRPVLSGFHAAWSIGTFIGALLGGYGAGHDIGLGWQQAVIGLILLAALLPISGAFLPDPPHDADPPRRRLRLPRMPEKRLVLLGVAAIFALMSEGAVADWSGVLSRDHLHATGSKVSLAYAAFGVMMTAGRLVGDRLVHSLGRAPCVGTLAVVGAAGLAIGLSVNELAGAVVGFGVLGLGLSIVVPVLFSTAADTDGPAGPAIAAVSALGCVGLLVGPSLIGLIAQLTSVPTALFLLPPFTVVAGALGVAGIRLSHRSLA